jgi:ABC-type Fe3+/spermidine/putrescine transport system ATPase subunit
VSASELLRIRDLSSAWAGVPVLRHVSLEVAEGEFLALMGPNGSGKTTLLRLIAGLDEPTGGSVELRGRDLVGVPAHRRGIGMLFQDAQLFPERSVWENVAYGPQIQRRPAAEVESLVTEMLELLRLRSLADRRPEELSGGERQRAALARTLAPGPSVVLLDEPFASVDAELRREMRAEFRRVLSARRTAAIFVTHDRDEGLFLGDRVAVLLDGELRQTGSPADVFEHPIDERVARFLGYNIVPAPAGPMAVDPSELTLARSGEPGVSAAVVARGWSPQGTGLLVRAADGSVWEVVLPKDEVGPPVGSTVQIRWQRGVPLATSLDRDRPHME